MNNTDLTKIYSKYYSLVMKKCLNYLKNKEIAKDLTQDIFIKIFKEIKDKRFINERKENVWIQAVSRNFIINQIRKNKKCYVNIEINLLSEILVSETSEDECFKFSKEVVAHVITKLPAQQKAVVESHYFDQLTHQEIGLRYGTSASSSKTNLLKAKRSLKKHLLNYEKN
jgi:RNA polymerase sigma-70 factor (ECF subfamily)